MASITSARRFSSAVVVLSELGSMDGIEYNNSGDGAKEDWREKHRLAKISSEISSGGKVKFWMSVISSISLIYCALFLIAVILGSDDGTAQTLDMSANHKYAGKGALQYASCQLGQGFFPPAGIETSLADFAFLSAVSYQHTAAIETSLQHWFKTESGEIVNNDKFMKLFKEDNGYTMTPAKYRLIEFTKSNVAVITIKGTSNAWDMLTDAQLWSSAAYAQYLRSFLPLGRNYEVSPCLPVHS